MAVAPTIQPVQAAAPPTVPNNALDPFGLFTSGNGGGQTLSVTSKQPTNGPIDSLIGVPGLDPTYTGQVPTAPSYSIASPATNFTQTNLGAFATPNMTAYAGQPHTAVLAGATPVSAPAPAVTPQPLAPTISNTPLINPNQQNQIATIGPTTGDGGSLGNPIDKRTASYNPEPGDPTLPILSRLAALKAAGKGTTSASAPATINTAVTKSAMTVPATTKTTTATKAPSTTAATAPLKPKLSSQEIE